MWNLDSGEPFKTFSQHTENVFSVAFTPDDQFLASSSSDIPLLSLSEN
ncbi:WD40 repeat domain-containing protein [Microcoleus sp. FACHB-SPT15]